MTCGRSHQLDAWVAGELAPALEGDLKGHVATCSRCRHELNWLRTEAELTRLRAGRDEVAHLWKGVARRAGLRRSPRWPARLALAAAGAALAVGLTLGARAGLERGEAPDFGARGPSIASTASNERAAAGAAGEATVSAEAGPASVDPSEGRACSILPAGVGFSCRQVEPASYVASR